MDEEYDIIVLGTGLSECVLSGLASVQGKKVLHMDRNDYYGAESASLNPLDRLFDLLGTDTQKGKDKAVHGKKRDYNVDLIPKMLISNGRLLDLLVCTTVDRYLDFRSAGVSFTDTGKKIYKVPMTLKETFTTGLMWLPEKNRFKKFLEFLQAYDDSDKNASEFTYNKVTVTPKVTPMVDVYKAFNFATSTEDFIGHSMALYQSNEYKTKPCEKTFEKILLYVKSMMRFPSIPDNKRSPYIYPAYGLGELPQGFARLSAVHGGTYMLNKKIENIVYDDNGKFVGVTSDGATAKAKLCIADPSYFPEKVKKVGQVIRAICILSHPIKGTDNRPSVVIVMPGNELPNKKEDMYITCLGPELNVVPEGKYLVTVSTTVESNTPRQELTAALKLLGDVDEIFYSVKDLYAPVDDGKASNIYISKSYDAASHFESAIDDIEDIYQRAFNEKLDVEKIKADTKKRAEDAEAQLNEEMAAANPPSGDAQASGDAAPTGDAPASEADA